MAFDGSLWGRRVQATGQTPVATATGFVALFTLDNFQGTRNEIVDGGANSALNGGGDIRVSTDDAGVNQLPLHVVEFTVSATPSLQAIQFWVRFPTYEAASRAVWVFYNRAGQTQPPVSDTFGQYSVWQDFEYMFGYVGSVRQDFAGNHTLTTYGTPTVTTGTRGNAFQGGSSSNYHEVNGYKGVTGAGARTVKTLMRTTSGNRYLFWYGESLTRANCQARTFSDDIRLDVGGSNATTSGTASVVDGNWRHVTVKVDANENWMECATILVDGVVGYSSTTDTGFPLDTSALNDVSFAGMTGLARVPTDQEAQSMRAFSIPNDLDTLEFDNQNSPSTFWTMGEPEDTGGAGEILSIDSGLFVLSGEAVGLMAAYTLSAQTESFTIVGTALGLAKGGALIAESGSYTISGTELQVRAAYRDILESGAFDLTGTDVALIYTPVTPGESIILESGSFGLIGTSATLTASQKAQIEAGAYNLSGSGINLVSGSSISLDVGDYSLNGSDIALVTGYGIILQSGDYVLNGTSVTLKYSGDSAQTIGNITSAFAENPVSVGYRPTEITVKFKES